MHSQTIVNATYQSRQASSSRYRFLVVGFHLLATFWVLNAFFPAQGPTVEKIGISALLLLAVLCFVMQIIFGSARSRPTKFDSTSSLLLTLLFAWCLLTIVRGFESDVGRIFTLLANPEIGGLVWLLPFAVFIGKQPGVLLTLLPAFRLHAVVGMVLVAWTIMEVGFADVLPRDSFSKVGLILLYAAPVVLLTGIGGRLDRWLYISGLGLSAIAHYLLSARAGFAMSVLVLMLALALGRVRDFRRASFRALGLTVVAAALVSLGADYILSMLSDEWFVDTRTFLWEEMNDDFGVKDWIVGRGALGSYYSAYFDYTSRAGMEGDWMFRQVNEIGYLHIALKAGLIGVLLYFLTVARATYKSLFLADKRFAVGLTLLLSMHLLEMAVVGQASFQPSRVLLWMLVGIAMSTPLKRT